MELRWKSMWNGICDTVQGRCGRPCTRGRPQVQRQTKFRESAQSDVGNDGNRPMFDGYTATIAG